MTYSLAVTGSRADQTIGLVEPLTLSDDNARPGDMQMAMRLGTSFLCLRPDGSQGYYVLDAERSTPDRPVLRAV